MCKITGALLALVFALGSLPAWAQATQQDRKQLEGIWEATSAEREGQPAEDLVGHRLTFKGRTFQIHGRDGALLYEGFHQLAPGTVPAVLDFLHSSGELSGKKWKGIYKIERNSLTICDNAANLESARPTAFRTGPGSGLVLITFARAGRAP